VSASVYSPHTPTHHTHTQRRLLALNGDVDHEHERGLVHVLLELLRRDGEVVVVHPAEVVDSSLRGIRLDQRAEKEPLRGRRVRGPHGELDQRRVVVGISLEEADVDTVRLERVHPRRAVVDT